MENGDLEPSQRASASWRAPLGVCVAALGALAILGGVEAYRLLNDPKIFFLRAEDSAEWIRLINPSC